MHRRTWDEQLVDYVRFLDQENRAPSQYAEDPSERVLFYWLRNQRSSLRNGLLLPERISKLNQALPGWSSVAPGGFRSASQGRSSWNTRLEQLSEHWQRYGRNPVLGPSASPEERALGKWLSVQRYALKKGTLYPERVVQLDKLVPGWRGRSRQQPARSSMNKAGRRAGEEGGRDAPGGARTAGPCSHGWRLRRDLHLNRWPLNGPGRELDRARQGSGSTAVTPLGPQLGLVLRYPRLEAGV